MSICPGCGRCRVCGQPRPYPVSPWPYQPWPYGPRYPYTQPIYPGTSGIMPHRTWGSGQSSASSPKGTYHNYL